METLGAGLKHITKTHFVRNQSENPQIPKEESVALHFTFS